ncbi:GDP-mannose 4,6-dehydratase [bacterium]|nr:GDP-mannose 4,6-dehydratase [bacterium]
MKIAVLGSNCFTASHFINLALEKAEIIGISRSPEYNPIFLPYIYNKERPKNFTFYQLDINKNFKEIISLIDKEKPDVVLNYAAQGEVRNSWKWPEQWFKTNCMAVVKLTNALKDKDYLKKYVAISTPEVYGTTGKNIEENYNSHPSTPYAASKLAGDLFIFTLHKKSGFPFVMTRSSNVYGVHQQLYRIIPRTILYLKMGKKIKLHGEGEAVRSFINIKDVAQATWLIIQKAKPGSIYHLAPEGHGITIKELVKMICDIMGYDFEASVELQKENYGQDAIYSLSSTKAEQELGWKPTINLKQGIKEVITWIDQNFEEIRKMPLEYIHKG